MNTITTTIKREYMDRILDGSKTSEFKGCSEYWDKRIKKILESGDPFTTMNFLCGQISYKFEVRFIILHNCDCSKMIDGINFSDWWEIQIGRRLCSMCRSPIVVGDNAVIKRGHEIYCDVCAISYLRDQGSTAPVVSP